MPAIHFFKRRSIISYSRYLLGCAAAVYIVSTAPLFAQEASPEFRQHPFLAFDIAEHRTADISLVDVDGDSDLDVITANGRHWAQQDYVFLNSGNGKLLEALPLGNRLSASYTVQAGDLDGDGDADAVVIRDMLSVLIYTNDGQGGFSLSGEVPGSAGPARSAILFDANGDGALDLAVASRRGPDQIYMGDGKGGFNKGTALPDTGFGSTGIVGGDIDSDGDTDLVIARRDGAASVIMFNNGEGAFHAFPISGSDGDHRKAAIADINGDERPDIILVSTDGLHLYYEQQVDGSLQNPASFGKEGEAVQALATGDMDQDGDIDLVAGADGANVIYINNGRGQFTRHILSDEADTYGVALGDMNGDNLLDIVFANSGAANEVMLSRKKP